MSKRKLTPEDSVLNAVLEDPALRDMRLSAFDKEALYALMAEETDEEPEDLEQKSIPELFQRIFTKGADFDLLLPDAAAPNSGRNAGIKLQVDEDRMAARLYLFPYPDEPDHLFTAEEIEETLEQSGISAGIQRTMLSRLATNPIFGKPFVVARGKQPMDGVDGDVKFYFDTEKKLLPKHRDDGSVDFSELDFVQNVRKDDLLCEIIPARPGEEGYDVYGHVLLPKAGRQDTVTAGRNVTLSKDRRQFFAAADGEVLYRNGQLMVDKVLHVENVDASTGNIRFIGSVYVDGRVGEGFTVKSTANIVVGEIVEGAFLDADGDIVVGQGIKGGGMGKVVLGGSLRTQFIENATIEAKGNIYSDVVLTSDLTCGGRVSMMGIKGRLLGGCCRAHAVEAAEIGNDAHIRTDVEILLPREIERQLSELEDELAGLENSARSLQTVASRLTDQAKLADVKKVLFQTIYRKNQCNTEIRKQEEELKRLRREFSFDVRAWEVLFPNVGLKFGETRYTTDRPLNACTAFLAGSKIQMRRLHG